jgi:preflagellin peptidase FlaK
MVETKILLDILRLIVGLSILFYASYTDIKTRRASNLLWLIMGSIGGILLAVQYFTIGFEDKIFYLIFIPIMIGLVYVLFQLRLIFGGADAKALMALAILLPLQPSIYQFPLWGESFMPAPWTIFSNSIVLFLFIPLSLIIFNLVKKDIKFPYIFLGYKMNINKARDKFVWPLEKIVDGNRKFSYMPKNFNIDEELDEFIKHGYNEIWVTPKVPFMIPLLAGFICTFVLGDILYTLMGLI